MEGKTIAFVLYDLQRGGAEHVSAMLCEEWAKENQVFMLFISTPVPSDTCYPAPKGVTTIQVIKKHTSKLRKIGALTSVIKKLKPDFIVSFMSGPSIYASIVGNKLKIPVFASERNFDNPIKIKEKIFLKTKIHFYNKSSAVIFQTNVVQKLFLSYGLKKPSFIIGNPYVDDGTYWNPKNKEIISAGRFFEQKNFDVGIDAFCIFHSRHPEYKYRIIGEGPLEHALQSKIEKENVSSFVSIEPFSPKVRQTIANSSGLFLPSKFEGMPNILLESLAMGVPSVSTDFSSGAAKLFSEKSDLCYLTGFTAVEMSETLEKMISNFEKDLAKSTNERTKFLEIYSLKNIIKQWDDVIAKRLAD